MNCLIEYENWLKSESLDEILLLELEQIKGNTKEIEDRFYKGLEFGTGGLRGVIGAGTNRMNIYTIRKATQGLANYILSHGHEAVESGVVIAYDSRRFSKEFAEEAARILATNDITVYLFDELRPTPILSFAVRELRAFAGIVITASHNPPEYNGYKVYNQDGGQITEEDASSIYKQIERIDNILDYDVKTFEVALNEGRIAIIGAEIDREYANNVEGLLLKKELVRAKGSKLSIVYTPVHGTGFKPVRDILVNIGFNNLHIVKEQSLPDPEFSTVKAPNPEDLAVFSLALNLAKEQDADIIMATDPDADRLGVLVKVKDDYQALNGNQLGALILNYLLTEQSKQEMLQQNSVVVKTIVTSELGKLIASKYNVDIENTLTGFKYIGEKIKEYEVQGNKSYLFGYEESYGYLIGSFVRDKDAVQITSVVAEMALVYKQEGKTLFDELEKIYQEFGYHVEDLVSITLTGIEGAAKINNLVSLFRNHPPQEINGIRVEWIEDYLYQERFNLLDDRRETLELPKSNVIKLILEDNSWVAIRPSGTEPKIKFYIATVASTYDEAKDKLENLKASINAITSTTV